MRLARAARLAAALLSGSCAGERPPGGPTEPTWIDLAREFERGTLATVDAQCGALPDGRPITLLTSRADARFAVELLRADWSSASAHPGLHAAPLPFLARPGTLDGEPTYRLHGPDGEYAFVAAGAALRGEDLPPRSFSVVLSADRDSWSRPIGEEPEGGAARLFLDPGAGEPPARLLLEARVERGSDPQGLRFAGSRFGARALVLWPGESLELVLDLAPESALSFALAFEPEQSPLLPATEGPLYRIELDGERLLEERLTGPPPEPAWRRVPLPRAGRASARLRFSVQGRLGRAAFLVPVVGPVQAGAYGSRPWSDGAAARPNVLLFLADTFRADGLAAYGGPVELTPFLNELAERSLVFTRARATSTYTLPSHASLFTGLYPYQAGISGADSALARGPVTLAELFAEQGYRTGAITDGVYVSRTFGLDRGFHFFDERRGTLEETLARARAFVDADDGRPLFLFVHSYHAHAPYGASARSLSELGVAPLSLEQRDALVQESRALDRDARPGGVRARRAEIGRLLAGHYRACVRDLDRAVGVLTRELDGRGFLAPGVLVFTSDHGEAFGEHERLFHSGVVFDEQLRVPLLLHGPGLQSARVDWSSSLVDVAPTLADLAGIPAPPGWPGASLLTLAGERPLYAFQCRPTLEPASTLCVVEGGRKLIAYEDPSGAGALETRGAFDLEQDPGELRDLLGRETWPEELLARHRASLLELTSPPRAPTRALPSPPQLRSLEALGYGGD